MKIALALDVQDRTRFAKIVSETSELVDLFKVGPVALLSLGLDSLKIASETGKGIFLDLKFFDIPSVVSRAISSLTGSGVKIVTVHTMGGADLIKSAVEVASGAGIEVAAVTVLTSERSEEETILKLAGLARDCGAKWVVCQPKFAKTVKEKIGTKVITPGIRLSESKDDHTETFTPQEAKRIGVDMMVIGRPVIMSDNPRDQMVKIRSLISSA